MSASPHAPIDSNTGATDHIIKYPQSLIETHNPVSETIGSANIAAKLKIETVGNLVVKDFHSRRLKLTNIAHCENLSENLSSVRRFTDIGYIIFF